MQENPEAERERARERRRKQYAASRGQVPGFVYCMHVPGLKAVKIGFTRDDVRARAHQLWHQTGFRHIPVWSQWFDDGMLMERRLHKALGKHRLREDGPNREYFALGVSD